MPAGLSGAGHVGFAFEAVMGTYVAPTVYIPILSETLKYTEAAYYSPQIRQQVVESSREQGYYHVEGDIVLEFDANYFPYLMHCGRHSIAKSGAGPYTYLYTPSGAGSASTAASGNVERTCSFLIQRNGVYFGYSGCAVNTIEATLDNGILKATLGIIGLSELVQSADSPSWSAPSLMGAAAHSVYVDTAGTSPAFASADLTFNGFTATLNANGQAQNRINASRSAAYVSYGQQEATYSTELDFLNRTEYDNFKNNTRRALKFESLKGGVSFAAATEAFQLIFYNSAYDTYDVGLSGLGDLIMAGVTGRALAIAGGNPYQLGVKSAVNIA